MKKVEEEVEEIEFKAPMSSLEKLEWFVIGFLIGALAVWMAFVVGSKSQIRATSGTAQLGDECNVHAVDQSHICAQGLICVPKNDHSQGNGKCHLASTPTPSTTPTVTPTVTPTPSPSPTISPTPTPTETPVPTPTPEIQQSSGGDTGHTNTTDAHPPVCSGIAPAAPILQGFEVVSPTEVKWSWWKSTDSVDNQFLLYGPAENNLPYSILNISSDVSSINTGALNWDGQRWARVCAVKNNCVSCSNTLDP